MDPASLLALGRDPFGPTRNPDKRVPNASFDRALAAILARVRRGERLIPLVGAPGTGKTLLLEAVRRTLDEARRPVRLIERGDLLADALTGPPAVLLVDEGDRANTAMLARVAEVAWPAPVVIAFSRPPADIVADVRAEQLRPLSPAESRAHLLGRLAPSGRQRLFTRKAIDAVVDAAQGNPRTLSLIAGTALFHARTSGASDVNVGHVQTAIATRGYLSPARIGPTRVRRRKWPRLPVARPVLGKRAILTTAVYIGVIGIAAMTRLIGPDTIRPTVPSRAVIASTSPSLPPPTPVRVLRADRDIPVRPSLDKLVEPLSGPAPPLLVVVNHDPARASRAATRIVIARRDVPTARSLTASAAPPSLHLHVLPSPMLAPPVPPTPLAPPTPVLAERTDVPPRFTAAAAPRATATLTESETAREDARAAREAAMEARDAMQIFRTARER